MTSCSSARMENTVLSRNSDQATLFEISAATDGGGSQEQYELAEHPTGGEVVVSPLRTVSRSLSECTGQLVVDRLGGV